MSMRCNRKDFDRDINGLLEFVGSFIPPGWSIELSVNSVEADMGLVSPDGERSDFWPDDEDHIGHWVGFMNHARREEGREPVEWED